MPVQRSQLPCTRCSQDIVCAAQLSLCSFLHRRQNVHICSLWNIASLGLLDYVVVSFWCCVGSCWGWLAFYSNTVNSRWIHRQILASFHRQIDGLVHQATGCLLVIKRGQSTSAWDTHPLIANFGSISRPPQPRHYKFDREQPGRPGNGTGTSQNGCPWTAGLL